MSVETMIDYVLLAMLIGIVASRLIDGLRRGRRCNGACSRAEDGHTISSSVATLAVRRARQASAQRGWKTRRQAGNAALTGAESVPSNGVEIVKERKEGAE